MKTRIFLVLVVGVLVAGLAIVTVEVSAQEMPNKGAPGSAETDRSPVNGPDDAREVETFFDELIPKQLREEHLAGATVAVVKDGRIVFAEGYGYSDRERQVPVVADETLFYPGSAGKLFTWTAVMQLVEEGELDLDADVNTYLDFKIPETYREPITMADLMTHTAGFEEQFAAQLAEDEQDVLPLREFLIRYMPERVYPPGEYSAYSNYGTALAGYVVERVSGEPYERYVTNNILKPLGMEHSAATQPLPADLAADLSKGYHYQDGAYDAKDIEWISNARRRRFTRRPPTWPGSCWRTCRTASTAVRASYRRVQPSICTLSTSRTIRTFPAGPTVSSSRTRTTGTSSGTTAIARVFKRCSRSCPKSAPACSSLTTHPSILERHSRHSWITTTR